MKQPKKPTLAQKKLIADAGLDPEKWMVRLENKTHLHIVDRGIEQRDLQIIDKQTGQIVERPSGSVESKEIARKSSGSDENTKKCPGI